MDLYPSFLQWFISLNIKSPSSVRMHGVAVLKVRYAQCRSNGVLPTLPKQ